MVLWIMFPASFSFLDLDFLRKDTMHSISVLIINKVVNFLSILLDQIKLRPVAKTILNTKLYALCNKILNIKKFLEEISIEY